LEVDWLAAALCCCGERFKATCMNLSWLTIVV
jgi:hypothetical protein